jgi:predicted methyltransferase
LTEQREKTAFFRDGKFYKLLPELETIEISGVRMH